MTSSSTPSQQQPAFVVISFEKQRAYIDPIGGALARYTIEAENNTEKEFIFGYTDRSVKEAALGDVLAPFPGRVEKGRYTWEGKEYQMKQVWEDSNGHALHGFVYQEKWRVEKVEEAHAVASYNLTDFAERGYPFQIAIQIHYSLSSEGLKVQTTCTNVGKEKAPFGIGFHPYFTLPSIFQDKSKRIDELVLHIPAKSFIEFDSQLKPTGKVIPIEELPADLQFNKPNHKIAATKLDNCFTDLMFDQDTKIATITLQHPETGEELRIWQDEAFPYCQVYSYDHSSFGNQRRGIAIEAETCCGFAANFNGLGLLALEPNQTFSGSFGIKVIKH